MKIMLIQAEPPDDTQDFNFPMGYAALDSVLTKHGHEVELLFTVAYYLTEEKIAQKVKESKAQIFGIGGMFPYLQRVEVLVKLIREVRPDAKIVLGGWMVTYCPELVLRKTGADFCICGEGEIALLQLLNALEENTDYSNIKGLAFRQGDEIITNGFGELIPLEDIPLPNWEKFPMEYYMRIGAWYFKSFATGYDRVMGWALSRGCPFRCNFCTPGVGPARYKRLNLVMSELHEIVERFHPTFIYWMDNLTMGGKKYCKEFCQALIKEKLTIPYFITGRVNIVDREMLKLLKESGCVCILYGLESANNDLLKFMGKHTTVEQVVEAVKLTKEAGLSVNISAMFGQPGETLEDFYNTTRLLLTSIDPKMPFSNNQSISPLTTFPGSPIYYWAKEHGYIKDDEDYYNQFFEHRWINYTKYTRGEVERALAVVNGLVNWNYDHYKAKWWEDSMLGVLGMQQLAAVVGERRITSVKGIKGFIGSRPKLRSFLVKILRIWFKLKLLMRKVKKPRQKDQGVEDFITQLIQKYF